MKLSRWEIKGIPVNNYIPKPGWEPFAVTTYTWYTPSQAYTTVVWVKKKGSGDAQNES